MNDALRYTNLANLLASGEWPQSYYAASQLAGLTTEQLLALNENMANLVTGTQEVTAISQAQLDAFAVEAYSVTFFTHKGLNKPMNTIQRSINNARIDHYRKASVEAAHHNQHGWAAELMQDKFQGLIVNEFDSALFEIMTSPKLRSLFKFAEDRYADGNYWIVDGSQPSNAAGWVSAGDLIPMLAGTVFQYKITDNTKIAAAVTASDQVWQLENANQYAQNMLFQNMFGFADASFMGVQARGAGTHPAGIFQNAKNTAITGTDVTLADLESALYGSLGELMAISKSVMVFANPGTLLLAKRAMNAGVANLDDVYFVPSAAVPVGTVKLLCPSKVALIATGTPDITISNDGTVAMTDSGHNFNDFLDNTLTPDNKTVSLFQSQMSSIRGIYGINWTLFDDNAAHTITNFKLG